ncbi:hypothetical protein ACWDYH_32645 [Nocardia goodfellowii]
MLATTLVAAHLIERVGLGRALFLTAQDFGSELQRLLELASVWSTVRAAR